MPGLDPGIHPKGVFRRRWIAGSSSAKTRFALLPGNDEANHLELPGLVLSDHPGMTATPSIFRGFLFALGVALGAAGEDLLGDQAGILADRRLDLGGHVGVGLEKGL